MQGQAATGRYGPLRQAGETVTTDTGRVYPHPMLKVKTWAGKLVLDTAREFRLTPSSRRDVKSENQDDDTDDDLLRVG